MPAMPPAVRPARRDDRGVPELLYLSAAPYYDAFVGSAEDARRLLAAVYPGARHTASHQVCHVAELDGEVVGVLAAFPAVEADRLSQRFLLLAVPRVRPRQWLGMVRHLRASERLTPPPPLGTLYVDALAVAPAVRGRGVARALLAYADDLAMAAGAAAVTLDTGIENDAARALYMSAGFRPTGTHRVRDERAARAVGGRGFVSFRRELR